MPPQHPELSNAVIGGMEVAGYDHQPRVEGGAAAPSSSPPQLTERGSVGRAAEHPGLGHSEACLRGDEWTALVDEVSRLKELAKEEETRRVRAEKTVVEVRQHLQRTIEDYEARLVEVHEKQTKTTRICSRSCVPLG